MIYANISFMWFDAVVPFSESNILMVLYGGEIQATMIQWLPPECRLRTNGGHILKDSVFSLYLFCKPLMDGYIFPNIICTAFTILSFSHWCWLLTMCWSSCVNVMLPISTHFTGPSSISLHLDIHLLFQVLQRIEQLLPSLTGLHTILIPLVLMIHANTSFVWFNVAVQFNVSNYFMVLYGGELQATVIQWLPPVCRIWTNDGEHILKDSVFS